jgi:predicted glycoside hydrolase/deacetylase ChbG (UPF0249 family)
MPTSGDETGAVRLIVNADDLGVSEAVNAGILRAHRGGIVTAASIMACGGAFDHAARLAAQHPELDIGVHLTLVAARPLLKRESSLTAAPGRFQPSAGAFFRRWAAGGIRREEAAAELAAQIERVRDAGLSPTHLDSHQHLHALPGLLGVVRDLARRHRIPFVRAPLERPVFDRPLGGRGLKRLAGALGLALSWKAAAIVDGGWDGCAAPLFVGFREGGRLTAERLRAVIGRLRPGRVYELMCHPGLEPPEPEIRRWGYRHVEELAALTSPAVRGELDRRGVRLCRFADLAAR